MRHSIPISLLGTAMLAACVSVPPSRAPAAVADSDPVELPALQDTLLNMERADQEVRAPLETAFRLGEQPDSAEMAAITHRIQSTDSVHLDRLKQIVQAHGWPGVADVGKEGVAAVFLLVQHADRDVSFQKEYLSWLDGAQRAGELPPERMQSVALLTDRVRISEGLPQVYGTQVRLRQGELELLPIEEAVHVDARREALGLPTLAEYLALVRRAYGIPE